MLSSARKTIYFCPLMTMEVPTTDAGLLAALATAWLSVEAICPQHCTARNSLNALADYKVFDSAVLCTPGEQGK